MEGMRPKRLAGMTGIGVDRIGDLADALARPEVLRFENLDTDIAPAEVALEFTKSAVEQDRNNSYLPFVGQARLRRAAAAHVARLSSVAYEERNVIISAGGLSGILNVLLAIVDTDDEVILTDPTYVGLINRVRLAGGVPRLVPFVRDGREWRLDRDALRKAVSPRTLALLLMSPSVPSGGVLDRDDWAAVADIVRERGLWLVYDAAMERILYDGRSGAASGFNARHDRARHHCRERIEGTAYDRLARGLDRSAGADHFGSCLGVDGERSRAGRDRAGGRRGRAGIG